MHELRFLVDTLGTLTVSLFLLRLLLQFVRTDFRNPLVQALIRLTNPVVVPLRRVMPPIQRLDTASLVAAFGIELLRAILSGWLGGALAPAWPTLLLLSLVELMRSVLSLYVMMTFGYVLLSWIAPDSYSPAGRVLADLIGPLLRRLRRYLPTVAGLDLSPMVLILCLYVLQMILMDRLRPLIFSFG